VNSIEEILPGYLHRTVGPEVYQEPEYSKADDPLKAAEIRLRTAIEIFEWLRSAKTQDQLWKRLAVAGSILDRWTRPHLAPMQRQDAELLGLTEGRISQITQEAESKLRRILLGQTGVD
jgi:hypothetical protein